MKTIPSTARPDGLGRPSYFLRGGFAALVIALLAAATSLPAQAAARRSNDSPLLPDERPRMLFQKQDLPRLKKRLDTKWGQAFNQKRSTAVSAHSTMKPGLRVSGNGWKTTKMKRGDKRFLDRMALSMACTAVKSLRWKKLGRIVE